MVLGDESKKIYISYESKEKPLAKAFADYIEQCFKRENGTKNITVTYRDCKSETNIKSDEYDILIVLCSPYSIGGIWIHFESGFVSLDKRGTDQTIIIPIKHSGLTTAELPHYLSSHQGLAMPEYYFSDTSILENQCTRLQKQIDAAEKTVEDLQALEDNWKSSAKEEADQFLKFGEDVVEDLNQILFDGNFEHTGPGKFFQEFWSTAHSENNNDSKYSPFNPIVHAKDGEIKRISMFLNTGELDSISKPFSISIGTQYFLETKENDRSNYYAGVFAERETSKYFHNTVKPAEIHDAQLATKVCEKENFLTISLTNNQSNYERMSELKSSNVNDLSDYFEKRLRQFGTELYTIKLTCNGKSQCYPAILYLNDSDSNPRIDIGLIKLISEPTNGLSLDEKNLHWLWCKDGHIEYQWIPEGAEFTCYKYPDIIEGNKLRNTFISKDSIKEFTGNENSITAYASDEEIGKGNVVNYVFSTAARQLLTCF